MGYCNKKRIKKKENFGYSESNVHFDQKTKVGDIYWIIQMNSIKEDHQK